MLVLHGGDLINNLKVSRIKYGLRKKGKKLRSPDLLTVPLAASGLLFSFLILGGRILNICWCMMLWWYTFDCAFY